MIFKVLILLFLIMAQSYAADTTAYRFSRDVVYEGHSQQVLLAVPLDAAVYAGSKVDFSDLRVLNSDGVETPYRIQTISDSKTVIKRLPVRASKPVMEKAGEGGIVVFVDLEPDEIAIVNGLTVVTKQRDFEYQLNVQGSEDGQHWHTLADNAPIYDYSRFMTFGNRDIELSENNDRYFKITVENAVQTQAAQLMELTRSLQGGHELQHEEKIDIHRKPLHIEGIELWRTETETIPKAERRFEYPLSDVKISQDVEKKLTLIDIEAQFLPLTGLDIKVSTPNFSRKVEVQIPQQQGIETHMSTIGRATLEALHFKDLNREYTQIFFPEQRRLHYQVVIHNQDNPPLSIDQVSGIGPGYQLLFLPQAGQDYRLLYGADKAQLPRYETAPIQELLRKGYQTTKANLGPQNLASTDLERFDLAALLNSNAFLGAVISAMVLVLAWSLYRIGKRIN